MMPTGANSTLYNGELLCINNKLWLQFLVALIIEFLANAGCIARVEFVSMLLISLHFCNVCTAVLCTVYY